MPNWPNRLIFRLFLIVPTLLVLLLLEVGYRGYLYYEDRSLERQRAHIGAVHRDNPDAPLKLKHIIRWHENTKILYDLIPMVSGVFTGQPTTINEHGFRGAPVPVTRSGETVRIAGIGDSVMFGWGVADQQTYLARLPAAMATEGCERPVEVLNSAVPGYNGVMAVETLKEKLLTYTPDVVVYHYVINDLNLPSFIKPDNPIMSLNTSLLWRFIKNRLRKRFDSDYRLDHPPDDVRNRDFVGQEEQIPDAYRDLLGLPAFGRAMGEFAALSRTHGFKPVVLTHFAMPKAVNKAMSQEGLIVLNSFPEAQRFMQTRGHTKYLGSPLTVSATDRHPSAIYHDIISKFLSSQLMQQRLCQ